MYWFLLLSRKHEWRRTYWKQNQGRYTRRNWKNPRYGVSRSEIRSARDCHTLQSSVVSISNDHLCMRTLSTRWVPSLLTIKRKCNHLTTSKEFWRNSDEFLCGFTTIHKIWIHSTNRTPSNSQNSSFFPDKSMPKKAKVLPSDNKVMTTVSWDAGQALRLPLNGRNNQWKPSYLTISTKIWRKKDHLWPRSSALLPRHYVCSRFGEINELVYE